MVHTWYLSHQVRILVININYGCGVAIHFRSYALLVLLFALSKKKLDQSIFSGRGLQIFLIGDLDASVIHFLDRKFRSTSDALSL